MKKIEVGHEVEVLRDIKRVEGPYAKAGEAGVVIEVFFNTARTPRQGNHPQNWNAKVKMAAGGIKTFRVTSLGRVDSK